MLTENERLVLEVVGRGAVSPRALELNPPSGITGKDVRVAVQRLVLVGKVGFDDSLKLVVL